MNTGQIWNSTLHIVFIRYYIESSQDAGHLGLFRSFPQLFQTSATQ